MQYTSDVYYNFNETMVFAGYCNCSNEFAIYTDLSTYISYVKNSDFETVMMFDEAGKVYVSNMLVGQLIQNAVNQWVFSKQGCSKFIVSSFSTQQEDFNKAMFEVFDTYQSAIKLLDN